MIRIFHIVKNSIKYFFKRDLDMMDVFNCATLTNSGHMSEKTYRKIIKREFN